jgi:hypothetical protein
LIEKPPQCRKKHTHKSEREQKINDTAERGLEKGTYCCCFHRDGSGVMGVVSRDRSRVPKFGTDKKETVKLYKIDCM